MSKIKETHGYRVDVKTGFDLGRSNPMQRQYFFYYTINITNMTGHHAQLLTRTWVIEDAEGEIRKVEGPGVVGETPWFKIGDGFEYTSACPLQTLTGKMRGQFHMRTLEGDEFSIDVPTMEFKVPEDYIDRY